ncbi:FAD-binding oxidoreductase [Leucobacter muris]|uniref:FAD-binding oxidoreductase n=1 Tax=Leucobacter muris TaxID=1935379 RepID=A0ABX5QGS6_9MICO|nr:FAD-binding oxidoreductase [Leucobacter muris]QAB18165.1 FAD-binding oxidoreductase [Leucobacter muris]
MDLVSWGRRGRHPHRVVRPADPSRVADAIATGHPGLAVGLERSYGDSALNAGGTAWDLTALDAFIEFDDETGLLRCEAGVTLREIQRVFSRRGWMLAVTPGTQDVTVGGAIANDVHGKNHAAAGTFGCHVERLVLLRTDGERIVCGPHERSDWFAATVGGLGLTGVIVEATIRLERVAGPWLETRRVAFGSLSEYFSLVRETTEPLSVGWIDVVTGGGRRGIFTTAHPCSAAQTAAQAPPADERALTVPFTPPFSLVGRATLPALNKAYYWWQRAGVGTRVEHYRSYDYQLDAIRGWNRMYGPRGFYQYQSTIPWEGAEEATAEMLHRIARSGQGSFLGVLKTFGDTPSPGMLSFPAPGVCFALDFPDLGDRTLRLFAELDRIVSQVGGRLYPAKDARMPRELFEAGYPRLPEFLPFRDPGVESDLARRLIS